MSWNITKRYQCNAQISDVFKNLNEVLRLQGEEVTTSPISQLIVVSIDEKKFYIKKYHKSGKYFRRYFGESRLKKEWKNLFFFETIGIPIVNVVAFGESRKFGLFQEGALITEALQGAYDLEALTQTHLGLFKNRVWVDNLLRLLAQYTRLLHKNSFVHNDLKWRNILIEPQSPNCLYFIDCPSGGVKKGLFLTRGIIKDLSCLDKVAKYQLSRTQRLRFYLYYKNQTRLLTIDKKIIRKVQLFFLGRE